MAAPEYTQALACPSMNFTIGPPDQPTDRLVVGPGAAAALGLAPAALEGLGDEAYYLSTTAFDGSVVLSGGEGAPRGTRQRQEAMGAAAPPRPRRG